MTGTPLGETFAAEVWTKLNQRIDASIRA